MTRRAGPARTAKKTRRGELGIADATAVEAVFSDPALYEIADRIPRPDPPRGGRPRTYPDFVFLGFAALADIYCSARKATTELHGPAVWDLVRKTVARHCPDPDARRLPERPPSRTWYIKRRNRLVDPDVLRSLQDALTTTGLETARELGLLDPDGPGSATHPDPSRLVHCDGKVITPLYKAAPGDTRKVETVDPDSGEITTHEAPVRFDPDAKKHVVGDGRQVHGSKFWHAAARGDEPHSVVILAVEHVPAIKGTKTSEADIAEAGLLALASRAPGCLGATVDTVLRGTHLAKLQREAGWVVISPVAAAKVDNKTGERTEKQSYLRDMEFTSPDGATENVAIWTHGGRSCRVVISDTGEKVLEPLRRIATLIRANKDGTFRSYVEYEVPCPFPGGKPTTILEPTIDTEDDKQRKFNRSENVRQIPPATPPTSSSTASAATPNRRTVESTTTSTSAGPAASARSGNSSTFSRTRSSATPSPDTSTGTGRRRHHPSPPDRPPRRPPDTPPPHHPQARHAPTRPTRPRARPPGGRPGLDYRSAPGIVTVTAPTAGSSPGMSPRSSHPPALVAQGIEQPPPKR